MLRVRTKELARAIKEKDFRKMYDIFEKMYNPYPVQMGRYEAFGKAVNDGLISEEIYIAAHKYYGNLWHYVGD